jgi:ribonuclease R
VDRVIPMLPRELSNDICSLNAGVDRLAMTCFMEIDGKGHVVDHEITPSIIRVQERMTYTNVNKILQNDTELTKRYANLVPMFQSMADLMGVLRKKRFERGAIGFNFPEAKVILDEDGKPEAIIKRVSDTAEQIIEEFMIAANETVAEEFFWREAPFLYRIHEQPEEEKVVGLNEFLHRFGYHIKGAASDIHPRAFQDIVERVEGRPEERVICTVMLRSMRHACYHPEALGHFGLASKYYSHFTSPIRRYPDLVIHRVIKEYLTKPKLGESYLQRLRDRMNDYAEQSSFREKLAEDAERESLDMKKTEYMERHLGDTFEGIISGVTSFGMFVELENTVEGLVHVSTLTDDYYEFEEKMIAFIGRHTRKVYKLGDQVKIQVVRVNVEERAIDFELA